MTTTTPVPAGRTARPVPRGRDVIVVLAVSLAAMLLFAGMGVLAAATLLDGRHGLVLASTAGSVGVWAGLWLTLWHRRGWRWHDLGFVRGRRSAGHLLWQVPMALVVSLTGAGLLVQALGLAPAQGAEAERDLLARADLSPGLLLVVAACAVLVLPAAEEVLFRRVLLDWAVTRMPLAVAVVLTAAVFAALHVVPAAVAYLVFLGAATAVLRLWHDTLWAPLALHAANNALVLLVAVQTL